MSARAESTGLLGAASTDTAAAAGVSVKQRIENLLATVFGGVFLALAVVVTIETLARKLFNVSIQGADELGGYALAVGSTIAFSLALMGRNHIRVDVFHEMLPQRAQAWLNWAAIVSMAAFSGLIAIVAFKVITDTMQYRSTAPTPWQTPLLWPQSVWYAGLVVFALLTLGYALRATKLLFTGELAVLNHDFSPKSAKEELKEELDDLGARLGTGRPS
jgi:TRAP-type C4-dicarboxylate transport system permease small subunit